jgi:REP element-mobilizing transposase RayT
MPRKLRIEYPGAMYHVMSRGNRRQDIFLDDIDRHDFLKTLAEAWQKTAWQVHAYCLMSNHYHVAAGRGQSRLLANSWLTVEPAWRRFRSYGAQVENPVSWCGLPCSVTRRDSAGGQLGQTTYEYDVHGRQWKVTDARTGTTTYGYNTADQVTTVTTPVPAQGENAQTTTTYYDIMGRPWKTVLPDNTSVTNEYYLTGQLKKTSGSHTYPVEYTYDAQGRIKTMKTLQSFAEIRVNPYIPSFSV